MVADRQTTPNDPAAGLIGKLRWRLRRFLLTRPGRDASSPPPDAPLVIAGLFQSASGIGESARACAAAFRHHGHTPICVDLTEALGQACDVPITDTLSPMPENPAGTLILHINGPETERALFMLGMMGRRDWRIIGYWAWELPIGPPSWRQATRYLSEVWTPSGFATEAIRDISYAPVRTVPHHVALPAEDEQLTRPYSVDLPDDCFCVLVMADGRSSIQRKNIVGAVTAFRQAFPDGDRVRMIIKSRNFEEFPKERDAVVKAIQNDDRVGIIDRTLSRAEVGWLQQRCDVLLSPHRSEGFGLHLAECMARGRPVIATGWSGNLDFMTDNNSVLLPYKSIPVDDTLPAYRGYVNAVWADPDLDAAATALRDLADNGEARATIGENAKAAVTDRLDGRLWVEALAGPRQMILTGTDQKVS